MDELRRLLFEKGRVGRVIELIGKQGLPDPVSEPDRSIVYAHALNLYGAYGKALRVLAAIPPDRRLDAERFWGQSSYHIRIGALHQAKRLLDRAFSSDPPGWLLPHLYNQQAMYYNQLGRFDDSIKANEQGLAAAERAGNMVQTLVLTGNRSIMGAIRNDPGQCLTVLERVSKQLLERDSVLAAANFLLLAADIYSALELPSLSRRCLQRSEKLLELSGSVGRLVLLKLEMGAQHSRQGNTSREMDCYRQALDLLRDLPDPLLESQLYCNISLVHFRKGNFSEALGLLERLLADARSKNLAPQVLLYLSLKGRYLIGAGAPAEGVAELEEALKLADRLAIGHFQSVISLHLCLGWLRLGQRPRALECLRRSLRAAAAGNLSSALRSERDDLETALVALSPQLDFDPFLARLVIFLGHHGLLRKMMRLDPPRGKLLMLRSLNVHDAPAMRRHLAPLVRAPEAEVRAAVRSLIGGWEKHTSYRISVLGPLRVFMEDRLVPDDAWVRAGVRRLFLFLLMNRGRWVSHDLILESIWRDPDPDAARKVLANRLSELRRIIEPWHLPGRPYALLLSRPGACGLFGGDRVRVDAEEFSRLAKLAEDAYSRRCFREARGNYRQSLDLYAGDLLEEYPYEEWLDPKRTALRLLFFRASARYASMAMEAGNLAEARRVLEEALFRDLGCGECLNLLLDVLGRMGLAGLAREWAERHVEYLKRELNLRPDPGVAKALAGLA